MKRRPAEAPQRNHGTVLVLVLAVTSMVGVIGLSSLLATRVEHRGVRARADAAQAQRLADGALQLVHARLSDDPDWRSNHTHDTWTADEDLPGGGRLRYRLQDLGDTDLADSADDPARLTVRVACGDAVRLVSIELAGGATLGPELVSNGDAEAGVTGFGKTVLAGTVTARSDTPYAGSQYIHFTDRFSQLDALKYDLTPGSLASGKTYRASAWVRQQTWSDNIKIGLYNAEGVLIDFEEAVASGTTDWSFVSGDLTLDYGFTSPWFTYVYVVTQWGSHTYHVDELSVREVLASALPVVRGSYRRELDG